jgi:hypothetical protein
MSELKSHPLAELFPPLDDDALQELAADIRKNGLRQAIITYKGQVLDGRNRLAACRIAGVEPRFKEFAGNDPLGYVVSLNLTRRHLSESQRAMVAAKIATLPKGSNQHSPIGEPSQAQAAKMLNVGKRSVERARKIIEKAEPKLIAEVEQGKISVSVAAKAVSPPKSPADPTYVRPADRYLPAQEERLGPLDTARANISGELATLLKGKRATLKAWMAQHQGDGIQAVLAAFAAAISAIEKHL